MNPAEKHALLRFQFGAGCGRPFCTHKLCASNPNSVLHAMSQPEIENFVNSRVSSSLQDVLCPGVQYMFDYAKNRYAIQSFDRWVSLSVSRASMTLDEAIYHIRNILTAKVSGLVVFTTNSPLSMDNSGINDRLMEGASQMLDGLSDDFDNNLASLVINFVAALRSQPVATFDGVRAFLLLFHLPILYKKKYQTSILQPVLSYFTQGPKGAREILMKWLTQLPFLVKRIVKAAHLVLTNAFSVKSNTSIYARKVDDVLDVLRMIWEMNKNADDPLDPSAFYNKALNDVIDPHDDFDNFNKGSNSFLNYHFVLNLPTKRKEACRQAQLMRRHAFILSTFDEQYYEKHMTIYVRRTSLLDDIKWQLNCKSRQEFVKKLRVMFSKEAAVDAGGPSREFFYLLTPQLFSSEYGKFKLYNEKCFWFTHSENVDEDSYFLIGSIIGLALYNSVVLPVRLPLVLYKKLCTPDLQLTIQDLSELEPTVARSLSSVKAAVERGEDISQMYLTFDTTIEVDGERKTVPIIDGMDGVDVTNQNAERYIKAYVNFVLSRSVQRQFNAFRRGFDMTCPATAYKLMAPQELDILVSGEELFDWDALIKNARYKNGYTEKSKAITWFWDIFREMEQNDKRNFLKFATGTDKAPFGGLGSLRITIERDPNSNRLPTAHTCFTTFRLPDYASKDVMKKNVMISIQYTEGFGLV